MKLVLEGSREGFERLLTLFKSGELSRELGVEVKDLQWLAALSPQESEQSEEAAGEVLRVSQPTTEDPTTEDSHVSRKSAPEMSRPTVLFADNNPEFLRIRKEILEKEGYSVITATNPSDVRRIVQNHHLDAVSLDLRMENDADQSDISGFILAKEISSSIPTVIMTAYPELKLVQSLITQKVSFVKKSDPPKVWVAAVQAVAPVQAAALS